MSEPSAGRVAVACGLVFWICLFVLMLVIGRARDFIRYTAWTLLGIVAALELAGYAVIIYIIVKGRK